MNKKITFRAALILMCAVAFSVSIGSCDKIDSNQADDLNNLSLNVDTNGVNFTIKPFLEWGATLTDVEEYLAKTYPDFKVMNDGYMSHDPVSGGSILHYSCRSVLMSFYFYDESGTGYFAQEFTVRGDNQIQKVEDQCVRAGLKYKGMIYSNGAPDNLGCLYLSADEKLEVQMVARNNDRQFYWSINFQTFDKNDLDLLTDPTKFDINITTKEGSYNLIPMIDFDASIADIRNYMAQNYADWEAREGGALLKDSINDSIYYWYTSYIKDSLKVFYYFDDAEGLGYNTVRYSHNSSTDVTPLLRELTRNGLIYVGHAEVPYEEISSNYVFIPHNRNYLVMLQTWTMFGGSWSLDITGYDEEFIEELSRD